MATQSGSPGLVIPSAFDTVGGIPPNASVLSAVSAAIIPGNLQPGNVNLGLGAKRSMLECMSTAGAVGTANGVGGGRAGNLSANGGSGLGAGGSNDDIGFNSGSTNILTVSGPGSTINTGGATPTFQG